MVTTTLNTMLPEFARSVGAYLGSFTTSTNIATDNSILSLTAGTLFPNADDLNDTFIRILGTQNSDVRRLVTDQGAASSGITTLTVSGAALAAESGSVTFELYRYDPTQLVDALNDARIFAFPSLHQRIYHRQHTVAADQFHYARPSDIQPRSVRQIYAEPRLTAKTWGNNIIGTLNCDFENSTVSTDWTASNLTLAAEAETTTPDNFVVFAGTQSGKCTVATGAAGTLLATVPTGTDYEGEEINHSQWVYWTGTPSTTNSAEAQIKAAIQFDSGTVATGSVAHSGNGWERLEVNGADESIATSIKVGIYVQNASGADMVCYTDEAITVSGASEPPQIVGNSVLQWREEGSEIVMPFVIGTNQNLLIIGHGLLSSVSSGTDTMEIDGLQLRYLYNTAASLFFQGDIDQFEDREQQDVALRTWTHFNNRRNEDVAGTMSLIPMRRSVT
jgi:hypothetical protein